MSALFTVYFYDPNTAHAPPEGVPATQLLRADSHADAAAEAVEAISDDRRMPADKVWVVRRAEGPPWVSRMFKVRCRMVYVASEVFA